jgi:hypothetical protein
MFPGMYGTKLIRCLNMIGREGKMDMDWNKVIAKLHMESKEHSQHADAALKEGQIDSSMAHIIIASILTSFGEALKAGLRYKGD